MRPFHVLPFLLVVGCAADPSPPASTMSDWFPRHPKDFSPPVLARFAELDRRAASGDLFAAERVAFLRAREKAELEDPNRGVTPRITDPMLWVEPGDPAKIELRKPRETTREERDRILRLIASLSGVKHPDTGLSATFTGSIFLPVRESAKWHTALLANHQVKSSEALTELVHLGPKALPFLLDALDDATPTQLTIRHDGGFGAMWFDRELSGNPANGREENILATNARPPFGEETRLSTYEVKIGDLAFVAIGQIVGRPYSSVRYQPTACIVVNSPVATQGLREIVRRLWKSPDPHKMLLESLLFDYATKGVYNGYSLDGWYVGSQVRCGAAMRLLYYFPDEAGQLITRTLDNLNVEHPGEGLGFMKRAVKNDVITGEFINAVSWSEHPVVRKSLRALRDRTTDPKLR